MAKTPLNGIKIYYGKVTLRKRIERDSNVFLGISKLKSQ